MRNYKLERLEKGETFVTSEKGNSMSPILKSGQDHKLGPAKLADVQVDDIVYCKVKGNFYTHLVKGKGEVRRIAMDLLYRLGGLKGPAIGALFGVDYSAVSQERKRLREQIGRDQALTELMQRLEHGLSTIKI